MNTSTSFKALLRISLAVLVVSLCLFSAASADRSVTTASPPAASATDTGDQPQIQPDVPAADLLRLIEEPSSSTFAAPGAEPQAACPAGTVRTCCSCGCG